MKKIELLLQLEKYKILRIEERTEKKKAIKIIYIESKVKKERCPICNEYTSSIHDKLRPIELKYLKILEQETRINIIKKRFICHKCNVFRCNKL